MAVPTCSTTEKTAERHNKIFPLIKEDSERDDAGFTFLRRVLIIFQQITATETRRCFPLIECAHNICSIHRQRGRAQIITLPFSPTNKRAHWCMQASLISRTKVRRCRNIEFPSEHGVVASEMQETRRSITAFDLHQRRCRSWLHVFSRFSRIFKGIDGLPNHNCRNTSYPCAVSEFQITVLLNPLIKYGWRVWLVLQTVFWKNPEQFRTETRCLRSYSRFASARASVAMTLPKYLFFCARLLRKI